MRVNNWSLLDNLSRGLLEQRIDELVIPSLLIWDPKIFDKRRINIVWLLNDQIIVDIFPGTEPWSAPNIDVSLCYLVEGMGLEQRKNF